MAVKTIKTSKGAKTIPTAHDPVGFVQALLNKLGAPATKANIQFLQVWLANEGNNSGGANGQNNPLNIQGNNPVPYNYPSPQAGVNATANLLTSGYRGIAEALQSGKVSAMGLAALLENSPWAQSHYGATPQTVNGKTVYVGGQISKEVGQGNIGVWKPYSGPNYTNASGVLGLIQRFGNAVAGSGVPVASQTAQAGEAVGAKGEQINSAIDSGASRVLKDILYGGAILGGITILLVGFVLIGADIGLGRLQNSKIAQTASPLGRAASAPRRRRQAKGRASAASAATVRRSQIATRREARAEELHTSKVKLNQARATELRTRTKHRRKNKAEQTESERRAYIRGATDAISR